MIHEHRLFLRSDPDGGAPWLMDAGTGSMVDLEELLLSKVRGTGPWPVLVKVDDLGPDIDMETLLGRSRGLRAHHKRLVLLDGKGRKAQFLRKIANDDYPYALIVEDAEGLQSLGLFAADGRCSSGQEEDDITETIIEKIL